MEFVGQGDADALGAEQAHQGFLVFEFRAGWVAEGIAAAAVVLLQHLFHVAVVFGGEAEFGADAFVAVFGHRLGHFDREAVEVEVVLVAVFLEPDAGGV